MRSTHSNRSFTQRIRPALEAALLFFTLLAFTIPTAKAQPGALFGKNKVQYKDFDWKFIQSPHFNIYFYQGGRDLAEFAAEQSEIALTSIERTMRYDITNRITILIYNSHNDFQQTNAVSSYLPEGVGGVTELFKNRVIMPFEGSYELFRHVLHHELVHAVVNDMFTGGSYQALLTGGGMQIPSWMNEGLAEYESLKGLDIETDMFMRDAALNDAVPPLNALGGYVQYRVGQTMYWYISQKYGPEKVAELLQRIRASRNIESGFRTAFGLSLEEFSDRFQQALKVLYYPDIARFENPNEFASEVLADHEKLDNFFNSSPEVSPQGDMVAFLSDRNDYYDVYVQSLARPGDIKRVISGGGATANFEELHLLTPGLSWSPDGKKLAIAAKAGKSDAIYIVDINTLDQDRLGGLDLDGIQQVKWSPDGKTIALVGIKESASDIYIYDLESKNLRNLTNDFFADRDPDWSADSRSIYFVSERDNYLTPGEYPTGRVLDIDFSYKGRDLYRLDLASSTIARLTNTPDVDEISPVISFGQNKLYYISNDNGINNIWVSEPDGSAPRPLTNSVSKIDQISVSNDGSKLAFSSMNKGAYNLYLLRNPIDRRIDSLPITEFRKKRNFAGSTRLDSVAADGNANLIVPDTTQGVGGVGIDLSEYVFGGNGDRSSTNYNRLRPSDQITTYKDTSGHYIVRDYRTVFSPDVILGSAGYTGYYGLQGTTQMLFSDQLGNHQIFVATDLQLDLRNSDYLLAYYNLQNRVNWGLQGFHTAQFVYVDGSEIDYDVVTARFSSWGLTGIASYPLSRFERFDLNINATMLQRDLIVDIPTESKEKFAFFPQLAWVYDNVLWHYFYPRAGTRYNLSVAAAPKLGDSWLGFVTPRVDYRHYFKLSENMSIATRLTGGASFGQNPQNFFIGGVEGWLSPDFRGDGIELNEPEDYAFFSTGTPLRGYAYNEKIGTKYALANVEFRFPFPIIVAGFPFAFFGDAFVDAGTAWNNELNLFQRDQAGKIRTKDLLMSTGAGIRTYLFGFYVHLDVAWKTNLDVWSKPIYLFSIGEDF
jgi:WD40 repeat protein